MTIFRRLSFSILRSVLTLILITALLYATVMLTPPETLASLYMPERTSPRMTEEMYEALLQNMIEKYHLNDPFPVQYVAWAGNLLRGNWGYSPNLQENVFTGLMRRAPATLELTFYAILLYFPLGLLSGVMAGTKKSGFADRFFRAIAFIATSLTPMILAILILVVFYITMRWFAPGRLGTAFAPMIEADGYKAYTGFLTIDGLLNKNPALSLDALRHIAMPALTLAFAQWGILGRITRTAVIEENQKEYIIAGRARGLSEQTLAWRYALGNAAGPVLTHTILSAASLMTSVFIVEIIFNYPGLSTVGVKSLAFIPDAPSAVGFSIYSTVLVLILTTLLDFLKVIFDPRLREES
ncbi:MAG: ABC transporter permease [Anaerolineaceae bacterium]|jgi:peptide/nickel transport system permease protein